MNRFTTYAVFFNMLALMPASLADEPATKPVVETAVPPASIQTDSKDWKKLEGSWTSSEFGGDGPLEIKGNAISIGVGDPLSGVRWKGDAAKENYEIELEARRTDGFDFFCGLTFPVGDDHVTFVMGGWGGGVVGISNIDGMDASENEKTNYRTFETGKWYKVRAAVDPYQFQCWIDDKLALAQTRAGHNFSLRFEMELCKPIGLAAYMCKAEYRNIRVRKLSDAEIADSKKAVETREAEDE